MFRLPVSGLDISLAPLTGWEDVLLNEARDGRVTLSLTLIARVAKCSDGAIVDWKRLTVTDLDTALLLVRRSVLGDRIVSDAHCSNPCCGARVDVAFRIGDYLASQKCRCPQWIRHDEETGWFRLDGEGARFRLPTGGDLKTIEGEADAERRLVRLLAVPATVSFRMRHRIERAMEALAPSISRVVEGRCPECGDGVETYFDVRSFVLSELRDRAAGIYNDVHLLALHYGWSEESILSLSQQRRRRYSDLLRSQGVN